MNSKEEKKRGFMGSCGAGDGAYLAEREPGLEHDRGDGSVTVSRLNGNSRNFHEPASVLKSRENSQLDRSKDGFNWNHGVGPSAKAEGCKETDNRDTDGQGANFCARVKDRKDENWRAVERCISASTKGFIIGAGLRGGLGLFAILSRFRRKKTRSSVLEKSNADAVVLALKETFRYGLFLGTFAGGFCTVDETIAAVGGPKRTARWRALIAGGVAGPALLLTGHKMRHTSMAIYVLMRATVLAARCGLKSERWGWLCRPLSWKHGDTFLMCLSSSQILTAWILKPDSLPSTYISFLNKHGGKDTSIVHGIRALAQGRGLADQLKVVEEYYKENGVNVQLSPDMKIPCRIVHGDQGCGPHFFSFLGSSYLRSLPVYLPVYFVPAILVHRQGLVARPLTILKKTLLGTSRSSLFLATYCASAWLWTCGVFRLTKACNPTLVAAGTFPTGLAVLIEKKSRRMELALYCLSRAIESFAICVSDAGVVKRFNLKPPKRIDVVLFSLATSIIMHCHAEERDVFRSKYLNVLDWVFGVPDPQKTSLARETPKLKQTVQNGKLC